MLGLCGEKLGMTQVYGEDGAFVPVTVLRVTPNVVTAVRTKDKHGYAAVQLGYGETKERRLRKPQAGDFKKRGLKPYGFLKEFRDDRAGEFSVGAEIRADALKAGDELDVGGVSKGRGFQGVMKRWHFAGGDDAHGCSIAHRAPGSIGQRCFPGRVFPGKKLPGHMGDARVMVKRLKVVAVEGEQNLVLVNGAVPGARHGRVFLYPRAGDFTERALKLLPKTAEQTA